jgi:hypothetical protein
VEQSTEAITALDTKLLASLSLAGIAPAHETSIN